MILNGNPREEDRIKGFIAKELLYDTGGFKYSEEASFIEQGIVDSLSIMQLVEFVQQEFHISVEQQEITPANFDSVKKMGCFIRRKLQSSGASGHLRQPLKRADSRA